MSEIVLRLNDNIGLNPISMIAAGIAQAAKYLRYHNTAIMRLSAGIVGFAAKVAEALGFEAGADNAESVALESEADKAAEAERAARAASVLDDYGNSILRTAYMYLHNMSDAEDILQDTLIQYIRKAPAFESADHEKAWLLTVAANLSKNKIKYNELRKTDELAEELVGEQAQDMAFVWDAVKQLPEKYREVIHLFYQEGYSTLEIAKILGTNESTVRSDLKRGRDKLKEILKEAYDFE